MKRLLVVAAMLFAFFSTSNCSADLVLDITGTSGSGVTTWTFSSSDLAGAPEEFNTEIGFFPPPDDSIFAEQGNMFKNSWAHLDVFPSSGATITTPNGTRGIDQLYLHELGVTDEIGFAVTGTTDLAFAIDDEVSWTGTFDLAIDLDEMNEGSYSANYFAFIFFTLDLTVNIGDSAAVPEPSAIVFLGLSGFALLSRRRRRAELSGSPQ